MDEDVGGLASPDFDLGTTIVSEEDGTAQADLELIAASYETAAKAQTWSELLAAFCDRFEASAGLLCGHDFGTGKSRLHRDFNISPEIHSAYNAGQFGQDPWLAPPSHRRWQTVGSNCTPCTPDHLSDSRFYATFLAPQGLSHRLCGVVSNNENRIQYISLLRNSGDRCFGIEEEAALGRLLPYVGRSLKLRRKLREDWGHLRGLLTRLPLACLIVDRTAYVGYQNPAAERLLGRVSGLRTRAGRLVARSRSENERLHRLIRSVATEDRCDGGEHLVLSNADAVLPLLCVGFSLDITIDEAPEPKRQSVALMIKDPQEESGSSAADFAEAFGLTNAEARLVALLGEGAALFEAADHLGITKSTARTHMRNIYSKVGTNRQTDIVRFLERFNPF